MFEVQLAVELNSSALKARQVRARHGAQKSDS
jgi:hypothetical protein